MATEDKNNERITTKTRTRGSACVFVRVCARSACRNRHVQRYGRAAADFDGVRARGEGGCIHINIFLLTFFYYNYYLFGSLRAICRFLAADITERCFLFLDISMRNGTRTNPPTPLHPPPSPAAHADEMKSYRRVGYTTAARTAFFSGSDRVMICNGENII